MELEMLSGKQAAKKINMAESTYCGRAARDRDNPTGRTVADDQGAAPDR